MRGIEKDNCAALGGHGCDLGRSARVEVSCCGFPRSALTKENDQKALIKRALGSLGKERMRAMASGPASVRVSPGVVRPRVPRVPDADDHAAEMAAAEVFSVLFD